MGAMKKDPNFKIVIETQKELKDTERFDWFLIDSTSDSYSIDCIKSSPFLKMKTIPTMNAIELFFLDLCIVAYQ